MKINLDELEKLPQEVKFIFIAMLQTAVNLKKIDKDKSFFIKFAGECWDTMEINSIEIVNDFLKNTMVRDIQRFKDEFKK